MKKITLASFAFFLMNQFAFGASTDLPQANVFVELSKKVIPSVVNISTFTNRPSPQIYADEYFRWFFEDFFGGRGGPGGPGGPFQRPPQRPAPRQGPNIKRPLSLGTGFIIDSSGLIVTNNHVIGDADLVQIKFTDDSTEDPTDAKILGTDPLLDVALIQVKSKRTLSPLPFGNSDALEVGEYVVAIGNPFGKSHSVTHGIISAKHRDAPDLPAAEYIQTDAPINPGNSGGPLVNLKGEVIGINNAIDARAQGIGFAIPINLVKNVLPELKSKGVVERGYIGVAVEDLTEEVATQVGVPKSTKAPIVAQLEEGGPAELAGMKPYDVILEINGKKIKTKNDLQMQVVNIPVNSTVPVKVLRQGAEKIFNVKIARRQAEGRIAKGSPLFGGLKLQELSPQLSARLGLGSKSVKGVLVAEVEPQSSADQAGLSAGDVIVEVNRQPITSIKEFKSATQGKSSYLVRILSRNPMTGEWVYRVIVLDLK